MSQPNPNDKPFEQQRSDAARAALESQTKKDSENSDESKTENSADNESDTE